VVVGGDCRAGTSGRKRREKKGQGDDALSHWLQEHSCSKFIGAEPPAVLWGSMDVV